jgi:hypothetical protein
MVCTCNILADCDGQGTGQKSFDRCSVRHSQCDHHLVQQGCVCVLQVWAIFADTFFEYLVVMCNLLSRFNFPFTLFVLQMLICDDPLHLFSFLPSPTLHPANPQLFPCSSYLLSAIKLRCHRAPGQISFENSFL